MGVGLAAELGDAVEVSDFQARQRLGAALFARVATPIGTASTPEVWLAGRRMVAVDGTCLDVADSAQNAAFFGRPGVNKGEQAAFPQGRVVALAECGTHVMYAAEVGVTLIAQRTPTGGSYDYLTDDIGSSI